MKSFVGMALIALLVLACSPAVIQGADVPQLEVIVEIGGLFHKL